jgi:hypothetical protein
MPEVRFDQSAGHVDLTFAQLEHDEHDQRDQRDEHQPGDEPRQTVSHARYGFGTVLSVSGVGPKSRLKVHFPGLDEAVTIDRRYLKFYP